MRNLAASTLARTHAPIDSQLYFRTDLKTTQPRVARACAYILITQHRRAARAYTRTITIINIPLVPPPSALFLCELDQIITMSLFQVSLSPCVVT